MGCDHKPERQARGLATKPRKLSRAELIAKIEALIAEHDAAHRAWERNRRARDGG